MQASKIKPNKIYAVRRERDGKLVRFEVNSIVTERYQDYGNPHDYKSSVKGRIVEPDDDRVLELDPDAILGSFQEYTELVERKRLEKEAADALDEHRRLRQNHLLDLLFRVTGMSPGDNRYKDPFRTDFSGIDIRENGIEPLISYLEAREST